jgi:IS605 OrfB family transposase
MDEMIFTYQTRLRLDERSAAILEEYAHLSNLVEHSLYAEVARGKTSASCKNESLKKFRITARQFNACRVSLEGKISACSAGQKQARASLLQQIELLNKQIDLLSKKPSKSFVLHQKKRRKIKLAHRLLQLENDLRDKRVRLCFGGKKLFRAQFYLKLNGFTSHQEWQQAWKASRNSEFLTLGSKDETFGNQTCQACLKENGSLSLQLRLPPAFEQKYGKHLNIDNVSFAYGQAAILASLNDPEGRAVSYRFKKDAKGWRVFASTSLEKAAPISHEGIGVIGVDLNADHIACIETDRFGNPIKRKVFPWVSYGKTREQLKAATGELAKQLIEWAIQTKKPVILEKLEFQQKKLSLRDQSGSKLSRLLSSFAYGLFFQLITARGYRQGVAVHQVNPAFTSLIGRINYANRYGLSTHLAAALCIARRYQGLSESPSQSEGNIPDGKGGRVAFVLPVRNRTEHVWQFWGRVKKKLKTVLAAHFRAIYNRSSSPPSSTLEIGNSRLLLV